jgi:hypothetical protein
VSAVEWLPPAEGRWYCLTLVLDLAPNEVFTAFGGVTLEIAEAGTSGAVTADPGMPNVRVGSSGGGSFALESSSAQGERPEVLRRLSRNTQAVSVGLAPHDLPRLRWYQGGTMQAELVLNTPERALGPQAARVTELLDADAELRDRLQGFDHRRLLPGGIELAERLIGLTVDPAQDATVLPGGLVLPRLEDPVAPEVTRSAQVSAWIEAADDQAAAQAVATQARRVASDWHLDEYPQVDQWITQLDEHDGPPDDDEPYPVLLRRLASAPHRHAVTGPAADTSVGTRRALQALRLARSLQTREALVQLLVARARRPDLLPQFHADLGHPVPAPARLTEIDDARRRKSGDRVRARATAQHLRGPITPLDGPDAAWNWLLPLLPNGATLTFVEAITPEQLLRRLGAQPHEIRAVNGGDLADAFSPHTTNAPAIAGASGPWSFALERGPAPVAPHLLEAISTNTRAVLLLHPGSGAVRFGYAEDTILVSRLDLLAPRAREGQDPERFTRALAQLGIATDTAPAPGVEADRAVQGLYRLATQILGEPLSETTARNATATAPLSWIPPYARGQAQPTKTSPHQA